MHSTRDETSGATSNFDGRSATPADVLAIFDQLDTARQADLAAHAASLLGQQEGDQS